MKTETLLPIAISLLTAFVVTWINITIKFAKTKDEAILALRARALSVARLIVNTFGGLFIVYFLFKSSEITRPEIVTLLMIFSSYTVQMALKSDEYIVERIYKTMKSLVG